MLYDPVVLFVIVWKPTAVLARPLVLADRADLPTAVVPLALLYTTVPSPIATTSDPVFKYAELPPIDTMLEPVLEYAELSPNAVTYDPVFR